LLDEGENRVTTKKHEKSLELPGNRWYMVRRVPFLQKYREGRSWWSWACRIAAIIMERFYLSEWCHRCLSNWSCLVGGDCRFLLDGQRKPKKYFPFPDSMIVSLSILICLINLHLWIDFSYKKQLMELVFERNCSGCSWRLSDLFRVALDGYRQKILALDIAYSNTEIDQLLMIISTHNDTH
jgi:hypothetical protein